jgi:2-methylisocitrate lyase-like PEP mutase family enzyme
MGAITAYAGLMAKRTGYKALYLSGGGVAANSLGMPDLGISTMEDVLTDARRIVDATGMPLLVDIDTGWGGAFNIGAPSAVSSASAWPRCTWRTRSGRSAAAIVRARKW